MASFTADVGLRRIELHESKEKMRLVDCLLRPGIGLPSRG